MLSTDLAPPPTRALAWIPRDIFAGLITSVVAVAYGLSFAALIFAAPLTPFIAYGMAATFLTFAVSTTIIAARGSIPFAIAGPDATTVAVTATLVAALLGRLNAEGAPDDLLAPVMIVMGLAAALTGLLLCVLGLTRAGGIIRFIPYPVIGGFLGATGFLMLSGAVRVITGHGLELAGAEALLSTSVLAKLAPGIAVALAIYLAIRRVGENPYTLPAILLTGMALAHVVLALNGMSLAEGVQLGWLFKAPPALGLTPTWDLTDLKAFPWHVLPPLAGDIFAVMFVTAISSLLNTNGLEIVTKREANLERDLTTIGAANLAAAFLGGYGCTISLNRSTMNYLAGARGRLSSLTVAAVCLLVVVADPGFIAYVPKFVLGGLLLYLGGVLVYEWLIDSVRRLSRLEYASLLTIVVLILEFGFIAGVLIGVIIGCATFAVSASRVSAVKFSFNGSEYRSSLDRGPQSLKTLARHGTEIQGLSLQSYIFFGSANRLYQQVKALLAKSRETRFLIFDFRLVTGIDSSAIHSFTQIKRVAEENGVRLVLVNMSPELMHAFRNRHFLDGDVTLADDLDRALEACERSVIAAHSVTGSGRLGVREWFTQALGSAALADELVARCVRLEFAKDEIIARQGEPADCMHFILEGRVGIILHAEDGRTVRVRSLGPQTTIGEMGLIAGQERSATIQAERDSVLYALSVEAYERLKAETPTLHQALLTYVVTVMAERLGFASKLIGVLHR
jgi:SulP family sulfate permease